MSQNTAPGLQVTQPGGAPGPPGPPGVSGQPTYIWRPGGVLGGAVLVTWADVEAVIAANSGSVVILVDNSLVFPAPVPATASTELFGRAQFYPYSYSLAQFATIEVADGGELKNPFVFSSVTVRGAPTVRPFIRITIDGAGLFFERGPTLELLAGATQSAVRLQATFVEVVNFEGGQMGRAGGTPPIIDVDPGQTALYAIIALAGSGTGSYDAQTFGGGAGGQLIVLGDSSAPFVAQPAFTGAVVNQPFDKALGVIYDDALMPPATGQTTVQGIIDLLKASAFANVAFIFSYFFSEVPAPGVPNFAIATEPLAVGSYSVTLSSAADTVTFGPGAFFSAGYKGLLRIINPNVLFAIVAWAVGTGAVKFPGGVAPVLAVGIAILSFYYDGTDVYVWSDGLQFS